MDILITKIKSVQTEVWWRTLSYILSAFFLVPNITMIMFLIYMGEYDFFSYDFFTEGVFGMKLFFVTTAFFLVITSLAVFSPVLLIVGKIKQKKIDKQFYVISFFFTIITWLLLIVKAFSGGDIPKALFILGMCAVIIAHISVLMFFKAKAQFISLGAITFCIVFMSLNWPTQSSKVISIGLQAFGSGGDLPITITNAQSGIITKGKLKLISPKFIYFTPSMEEGVASYSLSNVGYYVVGKK
jgi:hypothetical protein